MEFDQGVGTEPSRKLLCETMEEIKTGGFENEEGRIVAPLPRPTKQAVANATSRNPSL